MKAPVVVRRLPDWQLRLEEFVRRRRKAPFSWGDNNCCLFAADFVLATTGTDLAPEMRGTCPSTKQALRYLRKHGGVEGLATAALGAPVSPRLATVGDVVAIRTGNRVSLAICNGATAMAPTRHGVCHVAMREAVAAWRVGNA